MPPRAVTPQQHREEALDTNRFLTRLYCAAAGSSREVTAVLDRYTPCSSATSRNGYPPRSLHHCVHTDDGALVAVVLLLAPLDGYLDFGNAQYVCGLHPRRPVAPFDAHSRSCRCIRSARAVFGCAGFTSTAASILLHDYGIEIREQTDALLRTGPTLA